MFSLRSCGSHTKSAVPRREREEARWPGLAVSVVPGAHRQGLVKASGEGAFFMNCFKQTHTAWAYGAYNPCWGRRDLGPSSSLAGKPMGLGVARAFHMWGTG